MMRPIFVSEPQRADKMTVLLAKIDVCRTVIVIKCICVGTDIIWNTRMRVNLNGVLEYERFLKLW